MLKAPAVKKYASMLEQRPRAAVTLTFGSPPKYDSGDLIVIFFQILQ